MKRGAPGDSVFELGSEEWVALPDLGVPAMLAKVDTGARTSALHATGVEVYRSTDGPRVRFTVQTAGDGDSRARVCDAPLVARRRITSSNGARELRCVVATTVRIGSRQWPIEVTLTNRRSMRFAMLLGQRAILDGMIVVPQLSNLQGLVEHAAGAGNAGAARKRPASSVGLRIGLLGQGPVGPLWQRLAEAIQWRGHVIERIDTRQCRLVLSPPRAGIERANRPLPRIDGVIALLEPDLDVAARPFALAILRHIEHSGSAVLNGADATARVLDVAFGLQTLRARQVPIAERVFSEQGVEQTRARGGMVASALVVAGRVVASARRSREGNSRERLQPEALTANERRLASRAAQALGLGFARIDLVRMASGETAVGGFDASPGMNALFAFAKPDAGLAIVQALEARVRLADLPVEG
jgi:ribosomal protein S6--L-glutamate ligase